MSDEIEHYDPVEQIYHLKKAGRSFREIAKEVDLPAAACMKLYSSYMTELAQGISSEQRDIDLQMELERLDALHNAYWDHAISGDLKAAEFVLKVGAQRGKFQKFDALSPTDTQQIANILVVGGTKEDFIKALAEGRGELPVAGPAQDDGKDTEEPQ